MKFPYCKHGRYDVIGTEKTPLNLVKEKIGRVPSEYTPADLAALLNDLRLNRLVTSKVETGIQLREIS